MAFHRASGWQMRDDIGVCLPGVPRWQVLQVFYQHGFRDCVAVRGEWHAGCFVGVVPLGLPVWATDWREGETCRDDGGYDYVIADSDRASF